MAQGIRLASSTAGAGAGSLGIRLASSTAGAGAGRRGIRLASSTAGAGVGRQGTVTRSGIGLCFEGPGGYSKYTGQMITFTKDFSHRG